MLSVSVAAYNRKLSSASDRNYTERWFRLRPPLEPFMNPNPTPLPPAPVARAMRADARRNRELVIEAARDLMATEGLDAQMDDIARAAGVGVGTVYRHFPTKDDLIDALAHHRFERLAEFAREALAMDDPGAAFEHVLYSGGELQATDRSLSEVMRDRPDAMQVAAERVGLLELVREVLRRAQEAGAIRPDAEAEDVPMLMCGLGTTTPCSGGPFVTSTTWRRYLTIVIDGLRAGVTTPMPPR